MHFRKFGNFGNFGDFGRYPWEDDFSFKPAEPKTDSPTLPPTTLIEGKCSKKESKNCSDANVTFQCYSRELKRVEKAGEKGEGIKDEEGKVICESEETCCERVKNDSGNDHIICSNSEDSDTAGSETSLYSCGLHSPGPDTSGLHKLWLM